MKSLPDVITRTETVVREAGPEHTYHEPWSTDCAYYLPLPVLNGKVVDVNDEDAMRLVEAEREQDEANFETRRGPCSCLIGQVLDPWLTDDQRDEIFRNYNTETITNGLWDWLVDHDVLANDTSILLFLRAAQTTQDRSRTWGQALKNAHQVLSEVAGQVPVDGVEEAIKEVINL